MKQIKKIAVTLTTLFLIVLPISLLAGDGQSGQSIYIGPDKIVDGNFIKFGNIIDILGAVNGDVIVLGGNINISGPVKGDVIALGANLKIKGDVSGSVRAVGGSIEIDSKIGHNANVFAGTIILGENSEVNWDVNFFGGNVEIKGEVKGNIFGGGKNIVLGGKVGKNVNLILGRDGQLVLYPSTQISGDLTYKSLKPDQLIVKEGAQITGQTIHQLVTKSQLFSSRIITFFKIVSLFGLLVVGLVLITLVPKKVLEISQEMTSRVWPSLGWGFIYFVTIPVAAFILLFTIIGIPLGLILFALYFISLFISKVLAGIVLGLILVHRLFQGKYKKSLIWPMILGLVILVVVTSIPFFGWLIKLLLIWWAFGAMVNIKKEMLKEYR